MDKDPLSYSVLTYVWVVLLAAWGGVAGYIRKVNEAGPARFSFAEIIGEIVISAFVGVLTFYLCEASNINQLISAAFVGISGHMGSRAIFALEKLMQKRFGKL